MACSAVSTDGRPLPPITAACRHSSTRASRSFTGSAARSALSSTFKTAATSISAQPSVSLIAVRAVPLALMAIVRPSGDFTEVLPPAACTYSGSAPTIWETSISCCRESLSMGLPSIAIDHRLDTLPRFHHREGLHHVVQLEAVRHEAVPGDVVARDHLERLVVVLQVRCETTENRDFVIVDGVG